MHKLIIDFLHLLLSGSTIALWYNGLNNNNSIITFVILKKIIFTVHIFIVVVKLSYIIVKKA